MNLSAYYICITSDSQRRSCNSPLKGNIVYFPVTTHFYIHVFAKSINYRYTNTVKSTRYLVAITAKFSAGMKNSKNNLNSWLTSFMNIYRNTTTIIYYSYTIILMNSNFDIIAISSQGFIDRVIHYFIYQMMKTTL